MNSEGSAPEKRGFSELSHDARCPRGLTRFGVRQCRSELWLQTGSELARTRVRGLETQPSGQSTRSHTRREEALSTELRGMSWPGRKTDGTLFWKVTNGNPDRGMPSFSKLPELQRWQIVLFLRTLGTPEKPQ